MTREEFVTRIRKIVYEGAIDDTLANLKHQPGRQPPSTLLALSHWYGTLSADDKECVAKVVGIASGAAVYRTLAILDGVIRFMDVEEEEREGTLELSLASNEQRSRINCDTGNYLYELFVSEVPIE